MSGLRAEPGEVVDFDARAVDVKDPPITGTGGHRGRRTRLPAVPLPGFRQGGPGPPGRTIPDGDVPWQDLQRRIL